MTLKNDVNLATLFLEIKDSLKDNKPVITYEKVLELEDWIYAAYGDVNSPPSMRKKSK